MTTMMGGASFLACSSGRSFGPVASYYSCQPCPFVSWKARSFVGSKKWQSASSSFPSPPSDSSSKPSLEEVVSVDIQTISSKEEFEVALADSHQHILIVNWVAAWCRKCIYLKPKLEKLAAEYPNVKFYWVDVNAVPQSLVRRADVTKMPTIQLWENGEKHDEVIGGHKAWVVISEVREMLEKHIAL